MLECYPIEYTHTEDKDTKALNPDAKFYLEFLLMSLN